MDFTRKGNRIFTEDEKGKLIAEITYRDVGNQIVEANHTFVDPSLRGQGIAEQLVDALVSDMRQVDKKIRPTCPYVVKLFQLKKDKYSFIQAD